MEANKTVIFKPNKCTTENYRLLCKDINKQKANKILAIKIQNPIRKHHCGTSLAVQCLRPFSVGVCGFDPWLEIYQYDSYLPRGQKKTKNPKHKRNIVTDFILKNGTIN